MTAVQQQQQLRTSPYIEKLDLSETWQFSLRMSLEQLQTSTDCAKKYNSLSTIGTKLKLVLS